MIPARVSSETDRSARMRVDVPELRMDKMIPLTIPAQSLVLIKRMGWYDVELVRPLPGNPEHTVPIGTIFTPGHGGRGFVAEFRVGQSRARFDGRNFPERTGKHTRKAALAFLVACASGFTSSDATYNLRGAGITA